MIRSWICFDGVSVTGFINLVYFGSFVYNLHVLHLHCVKIILCGKSRDKSAKRNSIFRNVLLVS